MEENKARCGMKIGILLIILQNRKENIKRCKNGKENKFTKKITTVYA